MQTEKAKNSKLKAALLSRFDSYFFGYAEMKAFVLFSFFAFSVCANIQVFYLQGLFGTLNQLLGHLATDMTGLSRSQVAVITLFQINTDLAGNLELHLIKACFCITLNSFIHFISTSLLELERNCFFGLR